MSQQDTKAIQQSISAEDADKQRHDADCDIYSSIVNGEPSDGMCNCGYGLARSRSGDRSELWSRERTDNLLMDIFGPQPNLAGGLEQLVVFGNPDNGRIGWESLRAIARKAVSQQDQPVDIAKWARQLASDVSDATD